MTINLEKSLDVDAPVADVFAVWTDSQALAERLKLAEGSHLELTDQVPNERLSWKITGPEVVSTTTVCLEPADGANGRTKVTMTSHYANGIGPKSSVAQVTVDMEETLAKVSNAACGVRTPIEQGSPDVTDSAASWQRSLLVVHEAWVGYMNRTWLAFSSLAWWPVQGAIGQALQNDHQQQTPSP